MPTIELPEQISKEVSAALGHKNSKIEVKEVVDAQLGEYRVS
jgi:hypothetical protein